VPIREENRSRYPEDCRDVNLAALCQRCHLRYDAPEKARRLKERNRAGRGLDLFGG